VGKTKNYMMVISPDHSCPKRGVLSSQNIVQKAYLESNN